MEKTGFAYFVHRPRTADELSAPGCGGQNRAYTVVKMVTLGKIDYENFITDMKADRRFIEEYAPLCAEDDPWKCILVRQRGGGGGILVMPGDGAFVGWAARLGQTGFTAP